MYKMENMNIDLVNSDIYYKGVMMYNNSTYLKIAGICTNTSMIICNLVNKSKMTSVYMHYIKMMGIHINLINTINTYRNTYKVVSTYLNTLIISATGRWGK